MTTAKRFFGASACAALCTVLASVSASPLRDPRIPDGETATYRSREDGREWLHTERTSLVEEGGRVLYSFEYESKGDTARVVVEPHGMVPRRVESVSRGGGLSITSSTAVTFSAGAPAGDRIMLLSFPELKYLLRGFPFDRGSSLDVGLLSASDDLDDDADDDRERQYEVSVLYRGTEEVGAGGRSILSHKLELRTAVFGLLRIVNRFIPKTFYWFSVEAPHYLVAYEGSGGFPGSPKRTVEIIDYSGW